MMEDIYDPVWFLLKTEKVNMFNAKSRTQRHLEKR